MNKKEQQITKRAHEYLAVLQNAAIDAHIGKSIAFQQRTWEGGILKTFPNSVVYVHFQYQKKKGTISVLIEPDTEHAPGLSNEYMEIKHRGETDWVDVTPDTIVSLILNI